MARGLLPYLALFSSCSAAPMEPAAEINATKLSDWDACGGKYTNSYGPFAANKFQVFSCTNYNVGPSGIYRAQTIAMSFTNRYTDRYRLCFNSGSACSASSQTFSSAACNLGYENPGSITTYSSKTYTCTNVSKGQARKPLNSRPHLNCPTTTLVQYAPADHLLRPALVR